MTDVDWALLFRYLGRECTHEEQSRVEQWLAADVQHRTILESAMTAAGRALEATSLPVFATRVTTLGPPRRRGQWTLAAAASLVMIVGGLLVWRSVGPGRVSAAAVVVRTAATGRGVRDTVRLDDGTRVVLGPASTLRYPAKFGSQARDVYLVGEGYFEVSHDGRRPFRVHAGDATAEDLGTSFGVRAYAGDSIVRVVVAEGRVALSATRVGAAHGAVLTAGQLGRLTRGAAVPSVEHVDVATYLGWTRGRLAFDDASLTDVVAELARWYHAEFLIADPSLGTRRLTGSFIDTPLPDMLAALAPVLDVRFERIGDTVLVHRTARSP